jgi:hypothetical protein
MAAVAPAVAPAAVAPDTSIKSGPSEYSASRSATFRFTASVRRATFQCELDGRAWSSCESPKRYSRLKQGAHEFGVRARKAGVVDPTPAVHSFTVDTVEPDTTILSGPPRVHLVSGVTDDHSPSFTFEGSEPGSSFECRLGTPGFQPCSSPFAPSSPLPDDSYTFAVRSSDAAGNTDSTPATRAFSIVTPITESLQTAQAAADLYFPVERVALDVPASCNTNPAIDCPGGVPREPSDQLVVASTHSVAKSSTTEHRFDITAPSDVTTREAFTMTLSGVECSVSVTSANGDAPSWAVGVPLDFYFDTTWGDRRIAVGDPSVGAVEGADYALSGGFLCSQGGFFSPSLIAAAYADTLEAYLDQVGDPMCAAPGPAYLGGPCQQ